MFNKLDKESKEVLRKLIEVKNDDYFLITEEKYPVDIIENLIMKNYLKVGRQGVTRTSDGYIAMVIITRDGKIYDELEKDYIENLERQVTTNNYNAPFSAGFVGCSEMTNCTAISQATTNYNNCFGDYSYIENLILEFKELLKKEKLSEANYAQIEDMITDIQEKNKQKKPHLIKSALLGLWNFTKEIGAGILTACLTKIFNF